MNHRDPALLALLSGRAEADAGMVCDHCGKRDGDAGTRFKTCSSCLSVRYCSSACIAAAWPEHKAECRARQAAHTAKLKPFTAPF